MKQEFSRKDLGPLLKKFKYWTLYLCPNQYYLGKMRIVLNRKAIDLCELKQPEIKELLKIIEASKKALDKTFKPDLYNYATLGNCIRHHHWHIVPRYRGKRTINKTTFKDGHWNHPAWPHKFKKINKETMKIIRETILNNL